MNLLNKSVSHFFPSALAKDKGDSVNPAREPLVTETARPCTSLQRDNGPLTAGSYQMGEHDAEYAWWFGGDWLIPASVFDHDSEQGVNPPPVKVLKLKSLSSLWRMRDDPAIPAWWLCADLVLGDN